MKIYSLSESNSGSLIAGCFITGLLLILSRDTLLTMNVIGFTRSQVLTAAVLAILAGFFLWRQRRNMREILTDQRGIAALTAAVILLVPMLIKRDWQLMYFSILFYILTGIFLSYFWKLRDIAKCYVLVLSLLSVYSILCTYVLRIFPDRGNFAVPSFVNPTGNDFYNFGLAQVSVSFVKKRNFGIFREPGVYQFFLILGLYLNNYRVEWGKNWKLWAVNGILSFTILTTFATGGVIELGLLAVFMFFQKKWYRNRGARFAAYGLILLGIAGTAWIILTENSLYSEFMGMVTKFSSEESGTTRFNAIGTDISIFFRHPLVGDTISNVLHVVESNSTSTMVLFAFLGFLGGTFHVLSWTALVWDRKQSTGSNLILLLILFMSFNTQNLSWNLIFWLFPMVAMVQRGLPFLQNMRRKAN